MTSSKTLRRWELALLIGVALGQVADGDPKIINLIRRFFASNS